MVHRIDPGSETTFEADQRRTLQLRQELDPAAPAPTGAAPKADPTPAEVPGQAMGMAPAAPAPGVASRADAGSDAAGSGRPLITEIATCTDCGGEVAFDEIVDHWWHENPEVAAMAAYRLDGRIVHRDTLPAQHPGRFQPWSMGQVAGGRDPFTGRFRSNAKSAELAAEEALIDMDAGLYQDDVARRMSAVATAITTLRFLVEVERAEDALAVKAGMLVRHGSDGGAS
jgi:hypothetical protein